jgi:hypothetical protein
MIKKKNDEWKHLISLTEAADIKSLIGTYVYRPPTKEESLLGGYGSNIIAAIHFSESCKDEKGGVEVCNLMNGFRQVLLT